MKTRRGRDEMYFTQILVIRERVEQDVLLFWAGGGILCKQMGWSSSSSWRIKGTQKVVESGGLKVYCIK